MLALLHTARVHVETFERLARELDDAIPIRHEVQEVLLADALVAGAITDAVRSATIEAVQALARDGARVTRTAVSLPTQVRTFRTPRALSPR